MHICILIINLVLSCFILIYYVDQTVLKFIKITRVHKGLQIPSLRHVGSCRCQGLEGTSNDRLHRCTEACRWPTQAGCWRGHEDHGRDGLWASCQHLSPEKFHIFRDVPWNTTTLSVDGNWRTVSYEIFLSFSWDQPRHGVIVNLRVAGVHRQCRAIGWGWSSHTGTSCVSVFSFHPKEHVASCPRCAGRFGPHRGMDSSTSLCAGLRVLNPFEQRMQFPLQSNWHPRPFVGPWRYRVINNDN